MQTPTGRDEFLGTRGEPLSKIEVGKPTPSSLVVPCEVSCHADVAPPDIRMYRDAVWARPGRRSISHAAPMNVSRSGPPIGVRVSSATPSETSPHLHTRGWGDIPSRVLAATRDAPLPNAKMAMVPMLDQRVLGVDRRQLSALWIHCAHERRRPGPCAVRAP